MHKLTDLEITKGLEGLPGWERQTNAISRVFDRRTFQGAISFVNTVADMATRADHHPDIDLRFTKVKVSLTTYDAGGVTERDVAMARQITAAAE